MLEVTAILFLVFIFLLSWLIMQRYHNLNYFNRIGIPGPKPHFIFGNTRQIFRAKDPLELVKDWHKKYGRIFGIYQGADPAYVITDPEIIKEITVKEFTKFMNRPKLIKQRDPLDKLLSEAVGDQWKRIRITLSPAFTGNKLKQMSKLMDCSLKIFLRILKEKAVAKESFDINMLFGTLTMQLIAETVFALEVDCQTNPDNEFYKNVKQHFRNFSETKALEFLMWAPKPFRLLVTLSAKLPGGSKFLRQIFWLTEISEKLIKERQLSKQNERMDMVQLMLNAVDESLAEQNDTEISYKPGEAWNVKKGMTNREIVANTLLFLLAGSDTTLGAISMTAHHLVLYPEVQRAVQEEIDNNVTGEIPTYEEIQKLNLLEHVVSEVLRLFPLIPIFLGRGCDEDCEIKGIHFKKGMNVYFYPILLHYDEEFWPNAEKFDPSRFAPENRDNIVPMTYLPFGAGPRNCVGQRLALLEIKAELVMLFKYFNVLPGKNFETKPVFQNPFLLTLKNGVDIKIEPRNGLRS